MEDEWYLEIHSALTAKGIGKHYQHIYVSMASWCDELTRATKLYICLVIQKVLFNAATHEK